MPPPGYIPDFLPAHGPRILIIGAGPTGLGAAYRLLELGHRNVRVVERSDRLGGLAASVTDPTGFTWDHGGHVMFSHYDYFDRVFDRLMGDEFTLNDRESWVRLAGRWVPYPFQNNVRYLPPQMAFECLAGLVRAQTGRGKVTSPAAAKNFGEFIDAVFGDGLARLFMRPYNFKVWAHPPEMMNKTWIGERVAIIDYERALRNVVCGADDFGWGPNNRFKYPLRGGTGEIYRRFGPILGVDRPDGAVFLRQGLRSIDPHRRVATLDGGQRIAFDHLLSTMPLDLLCRDAVEGVPANVREAAGSLRHASGHFVGIGIRRPCPSTKCWMYFPEDNCPFYRVTYLSNYSPHMTPDNATHYSLLCETSQSDHKPVNADTIVEDTLRGLEAAGLLEPGERRDVVSRWHVHVPYSYPVPTVDRDDILSLVIPWLESHAISSRGRFGMWKYEVANTDHSLMQGVEWANHVLRGEQETTIGLRYEVTEDGRRGAIHERAAAAGSGEKRLPVEVKPRAGQAARP